MDRLNILKYFNNCTLEELQLLKLKCDMRVRSLPSCQERREALYFSNRIFIPLILDKDPNFKKFKLKLS